MAKQSKYEMAERIAARMGKDDKLPAGLTEGQMTWALMALKTDELRRCFDATFAIDNLIARATLTDIRDIF